MSNVVNNVISYFESKEKGRKVTRIVDYDDKHYVVIAPLTGKARDMNGSMFGLDKSTKEITSFSPLADGGRLFDIVDEKTIYSSN